MSNLSGVADAHRLNEVLEAAAARKGPQYADALRCAVMAGTNLASMGRLFDGAPPEVTALAVKVLEMTSALVGDLAVHAGIPRAEVVAACLAARGDANDMQAAQQREQGGANG
jgi:hypothetical protein